MTSGIQIFCSCCGKAFVICRSCFKNQKYCSDECRNAGYQANHRAAQKKYSSKEEVKKKHAEEERRRRKEIKKGKGTSLWTKTCICIMMVIHSIFFQFDPIVKSGVCANCGEKVDMIVEYREPLDNEGIIYLWDVVYKKTK